jgi:hypothetical protein
VDLLVVEASTHRPVEEFTIRHHHEPQVRGPIVTRRYNHGQQPSHHPDGRLSLPDVKSGDNVLLVLPTDERLMPKELRFRQGAQSPPRQLVVELADAVEVVVVVMFRDGRPADGSCIELVQACGPTPATITTETPALNPEELCTFRSKLG